MAKGITLKGVKQTERVLQALARNTEAENLRKHTRQGAKVIQAEAQTNSMRADASGELAAAIGILNNPEDRTGVYVTARRGKAHKKGYIAHIAEYGQAPHLIKPKQGKILRYGQGPAYLYAPVIHHPGAPATPFMRPAWEAKKQTALERIAQGIKEELQRTAKRS